MAESIWYAVAREAATLALGPRWSCWTSQLRHGLYVTKFAVPAHDGWDEAIEILGWGPTHSDAYRCAVRHMAEPEDGGLTTAEVAVVLGCSPTSVRDHARRGRLLYLTRGNSNTPSRFHPQHVWALLVALDKFGAPEVKPDGV